MDNFQHLLKTILLWFFILFFIKLHLTGDIAKYINPKYHFMSKLAIGILIIFFLIQLPRIFQTKHSHHACSAHCHHDHDHWNFAKMIGFVIVTFPLITGFAIPPATLDSSIAANKGAILSQISSGQKTFEEVLMESSQSLTDKENIDIYSSEHIPLVNENYLSEVEINKKNKWLQDSQIIEMDEDIFIAYYNQINEQPENFVGRRIRMKGYVFNEGDFEKNQFVLARYFITHCVADASVIGFLTELEGAEQLQQDVWLELEGVLAVGHYEGSELPIIKVTKWNMIDEPNEPYIFPIQTLVQ